MKNLDPASFFTIFICGPKKPTATPKYFRKTYQTYASEHVWRNRQIKTLIKRNGRHLNTSGSLA